MSARVLEACTYSHVSMVDGYDPYEKFEKLLTPLMIAY